MHFFLIMLCALSFTGSTLESCEGTYVPFAQRKNPVLRCPAVTHRVNSNSTAPSSQQNEPHAGSAVNLHRELQEGFFLRDFIRLIEQSDLTGVFPSQVRILAPPEQPGDGIIHFLELRTPPNDLAFVSMIDFSDFIRIGQPYAWGFDGLGRPFITIVYTVEFIGPRALELNVQPDRMYIQTFFRNTDRPGNWAAAGTGQLARCGGLTSQEFVTMAELIIYGLKESDAHGARALLRLAKIPPIENKHDFDPIEVKDSDGSKGKKRKEADS